MPGSPPEEVGGVAVMFLGKSCVQGAAGRDAAWAGGVGIAVACPQGCQVVKVWRLYHRDGLRFPDSRRASGRS